AESGLDADFIRKLYAQIIEHSCDLEDKIINAAAADKKQAS
ncbi:MAG TPA: 4-amino-4-deoxychorismate mutase, partial [Rhodospirillaceae bacterium]|nr:4-amino-4-deoxychorismate mutase [Rhodospirillaceae bacterium]